MELTRVIHPIGQGGFYTETFKDNDEEVFNVVYDCGSETGKPYDINSYLKKYYPDSTKHPKKEIDAIFVSHLHNDHINGLECLLGNTNVKYLFLPQLTEEIILESLLYNAYLNKGSWNSTNNLILDLYGFGNDENLKNKETRIIKIKIDSENNDNSESEVTDFDSLKQESYNSGTVFMYGRCRWLYIPINSQPNIPKKNNVCFYDFFKQEVNNGTDFSLTEIKGIFERNKQTCIDAYTNYFSGHNSYSMTLFSGTDILHIFDMCRKRDKCRCCHHCKDFAFHNHFPANFLYTGDFEPNKTNLQVLKDTLLNKKTGFPYLWDTVSGIQVPHHGSRNNFNCELYVNPCVGYISAGSRNRHKHPNVDTLVNIHKKGCWPIVVSEDPSSMQVEVYRF